MSTGEFIAAIIVFIMAGILFLLGIRHFAERGVLLNNAYLYASEKERRAMDKKPYYRQSAIVFCLLGIVFVIIGLAVIFQNSKLFLLEAVFIAAAVIYAIVSSVKISKRKKNEKDCL